VLYALKVGLLKRPRVNAAVQRLGGRTGSASRLPEYVRAYAPGKHFADVGCMWNVHGAYTFAAEEAGAASAVGVDVSGPTPEFEAERQRRDSRVRFVQGDITDPETTATVGEAQVVLCAGVLYHHPSPFEILTALRRICTETLILRTSTIPELPGLRNMAVYWPGLSERQRRRWSRQRLGLDRQAGITDAYDPGEGYGNWFWGMTPSCVGALLETAGFEVTERHAETFAHTFLCRPTTLSRGPC
jgi:SAM-dependent methyltransferase